MQLLCRHRTGGGSYDPADAVTNSSAPYRIQRQSGPRGLAYRLQMNADPRDQRRDFQRIPLQQKNR